MPTLSVWLTESDYKAWVLLAEGRSVTGAKLAGDVIAKVLRTRAIQRKLEIAE